MVYDYSHYGLPLIFVFLELHYYQVCPFKNDKCMRLDGNCLDEFGTRRYGQYAASFSGKLSEN